MPVFASPSFSFVQQNNNRGSGAGTTLSVSLDGVAKGDLLIVGYSSYGGNSFSVSDGINAWNAGPSTTGSSIYGGCFWAVAATSGTVAVTLTAAATAYLGMVLSEYALTPGSAPVLAGTNSGSGTSTGPTSGPISFSGSGDFLIHGTLCEDDNSQISHSPGTGFTSIANFLGRSGFNIGQIDEYNLNLSSSSSPLAATATWGSAASWVACGMAFQAIVPPIVITPTIVPANHAGNITLALTGNGTNWTGGTTFTASGAGVTKVSQSIISTTSATLVVTTGSSTGVCTISDGTSSATINVLSPSLSLIPAGTGENISESIAASGTHTLWLSGPSPLFSISGISGVAISGISVAGDTTATFTLTSGSSTGTATVTDLSTGLTHDFAVYETMPGITADRTTMPINTYATFMLTGVHTNWTDETIFTLSGTPGSTFYSSWIISATSATVTLISGPLPGTTVISDGSYVVTLQVLGATIGQAYIGRSAQIAYFVINSPFDSFDPVLTPTYSIIGTTVVAGGSDYTSPRATIAGNCVLGIPVVVDGSIVSIPVIVPGSGYTSANPITIIDPTGTNATVVPITGGPPTSIRAINSNPIIAVNGNAVALALYVNSILMTAQGSGYTSAPNVMISGGSGRGATGIAIIENGGVASVLMSNPGWGFRNGDTLVVTITGGGGSGATATATLGPIWPNGGYNFGVISPSLDWQFVPYQMLCGSVASVLVQAGGSGFTNPAAAVSGGGGSGLILGTPILINGVIASIPVTNEGSGYFKGDTVYVSDFSPNPGSGFVGYTTVSLSGQITGVIVESGGSGYNSGSLVVSATNNSNGSGVAFTIPTLGNGGIVNGIVGSVPVISGGIGYTSSPVIGIADTHGGSGSGAIAVTIMSGPAATDAVTFSWSAGGLSTDYGVTPAYTNVPMANHAGTLEPVFAQMPRTMPIGHQQGPPYNYSSVIPGFNQNWIKGFYVNFIGAVSTADGRPLAINGTTNPLGGSTGGYPTAWNRVADPVGGGTMPGIWTLTADESNPSNPLIVTLYANNALVSLYSNSQGNLVDGVAVGKTWQWDVTGIGNQDIIICFSINSIGSSAPWTLANEYITAPQRGTGAAQLPDRSSPYNPEPNLVSYMLPAKGTTPAYPACFRTTGFGNSSPGENNAVDASDLQPATAFTYAGTGAASPVGIEIRPYVVSPAGSPPYHSPYVWTNQNYLGTSAMAGGPAAYAWTPADTNWVAVSIPGGNVAAEIITAQPHGLKTGQFAFIEGIPSYVVVNDINNANPGITVNVSFNGGYLVWVTGATTFAIAQTNNGAVTVGVNVCPVAAVNTFGGFSISTGPPAGDYSQPYEVTASLVAAIPGCGMHTLVSGIATDACIAVIATAIRNNLPADRKIYPELMDEHWNTTSYPQWIFWHQAGNLSANSIPGVPSADVTSDGFFALRQSQIADIFANHGNPVVRIFGAQLGGNAVALNMIQFANTYNSASPANPLRIDAIMISVYPDMDVDILVTAAAASTYSNRPGSIQYLSTTPWTMGMYADLLRHAIFYSSAYIPDIQSQIGAIDVYKLVPGQTETPFLMAYEASIQDAVPWGVSTKNWFTRATISHDLNYHPYFYDTDQAFYMMCQQAGITLCNVDELIQARGTGGGVSVEGNPDNNGVTLWGYLDWFGQTWGHGDGSPDGNGNPTVNQTFNATGSMQDLVNVSPKMQSWRDWVSAVGTPSQPTTTNAIPLRWFPRMGHRNRISG